MDVAAFFKGVRPTLYSGALDQNQVDCLNAILKAWEKYGDGDYHQLAYILATAHHETGRFKWLKEIWGPTLAQKRYEGRKDLGNHEPGDGKKFMGRGFVQITGRSNYSDWSRRLGLDLLKEPDLAMEMDVAARILVQGMMEGTFTGKRLSDYRGDYLNARRVVNGTDKAALIAEYAVKFAAALKLAGRERVETEEAAPGTPEPSMPSPVPKGNPGGIAAIVVTLVLAAVYAIAKLLGVPLP